MNRVSLNDLSAAARQKFWNGKSVLVTGSSGFIANSLIEELLRYECRITCWSRLAKPGNFDKGRAVVRWMNGALDDPVCWRKAMKGIDTIFHCAAQTSAYKAEVEPSADLMANVLPLSLLVETAHELKTRPQVVFSGTVTQVGVTKRVPVSESRRDRPVTTYDLHKLMAEKILKHYSAVGNVNGVTLRLPNVYGPGPRSSSSDRGILNMMIRRGINRETLTVYGKGQYLRDYIYIKDVVSAFMMAAERAENLSGQHFVIGSGRGHTLADAIHCVAERCGSAVGGPVRVEYVKAPEGMLPVEKRNFVADYSRFTQATGWRPRVMLKEGIDQTIAAIQGNI